ncbi:MAG: enoate reductase, partial [Oscillospiraceae bacterium]|nr:enoate reductase [Oscillospiraceae bacterium]
MKKLADSVHAHGSKIFVQLQHPGRQSIPVFPTFWPALERLQKVWPGVWKKAFAFFSSVSTDTGSADPETLKKQQHFLKPVLAPSVLPPEEDDGALAVVKTRAFTTREIKSLVRQFIRAAERAQKAGFDGVELHAAHGYLFEQFLSPWTNRRTDAYGGSLENRCRILKEIIAGIHARCGKDFP